MRILVTGASGYVGSLLAPRLARDGHRVLALGRDAERVRSELGRDASSEEVEVVVGDAATGDGLADAMRGVDVAYYLIHSMERAARGGRDFAALESLCAENFVAAARRAGVGRVVYLGGMTGIDEPGPPQGTSRHLSSRRAVEEILLAGVPGSVALRASIVVGARSRSFRLLVHLVERMPVIALPSWQRYRTQPIDERDVVAMLAACATRPRVQGSLDAAGPDVLSYGEIVTEIADLMLVGRPSIRVGVNLNPLTSRVAAAIAGEEPELVVPLMESLQRDLLARDGRAAALLGVHLHHFDAAVEHALREWENTERLAAR